MKTVRTQPNLFIVLTVIAFLFSWNSPAMAQFGGYREDKNGNLVPPSSTEQLLKMREELLQFTKEIKEMEGGSVSEEYWQRYLLYINSLKLLLEHMPIADLFKEENRELMNEINDWFKRMGENYLDIDAIIKEKLVPLDRAPDVKFFSFSVKNENNKPLASENDSPEAGFLAFAQRLSQKSLEDGLSTLEQGYAKLNKIGLEFAQTFNPWQPNPEKQRHLIAPLKEQMRELNELKDNVLRDLSDEDRRNGKVQEWVKKIGDLIGTLEGSLMMATTKGPGF